MVKGRVDHKEGETKLIAQEISAFESVAAKRTVRLRIDATKAAAGIIGELATLLQEFPGEGQVFLRAPVYVAETAAQARSEPEESIMYFYRYLGERLEDSATRAGVRAIEDRAARGRLLQTITYDEALRDKIIVGTPAQVVDRLGVLREQLGLSGILAEMNCGNRIPHEQVLTSLQLLCEDVIPKFRS